MKENIIFVDTIDYIFEASQLLQCLVPKERQLYVELKKNIEEKYEVCSAHMQECFAFSEECLKRADAAFFDRKAQIELYFAEIEKGIYPVNLVLCWDGMVSQNVQVQDAGEILAHYRELSDAERDALFFRELVHDMDIEEFDSMVGCRERGVFVDEAQRLRNIFGYIQKIELKTESKIRIQEIFLNRDAYVEGICSLLDEAIVLLHGEEKKIRELCGVWAAYWRKVVEEERFLPMLQGFVNMNEDMLKNGICIAPSIVRFYAIMVNVYGKLIPKRSTCVPSCRIGIMLGETYNWNSQKEDVCSWEEMPQVFKALGDSSRAEILRFIKDKPAYGSEIAKKFQLTTATVSHHMNKLVELGLVQTEMRDGRVYFQAHKEVLREMFLQCEKMFR